MNRGWLFVLAYTCSGMAALVYQVTWTRLLGLYLGHSTAAASTVVATFMGGLSLGAAIAGRRVGPLTARQAVRTYALLESIVVASAVALPWVLELITPVLRSFYDDGQPGPLFAGVRLLVCGAILLVPALALGATFPTGIHCFVGVEGKSTAWRNSGTLYAANTVGAAIGALGAGFVLLPMLGHTATTLVGAAATGVSIIAALASDRGAIVPAPHASPRRKIAARASASRSNAAAPTREPWLAAVVLGFTGFATFVFEIAWTRLFAMVIGPSTYAFSATVATFIGALAAGGVLGAGLATRTRRPMVALALALVGSAIAATWASSYAGTTLPARVATDLAASSGSLRDALFRHAVLIAWTIVPSALTLGVAFPLALEIVGGRSATAARHVATAYAVNTVAAVAGAMAAGFVLIPLAGLQQTVRLASAALLAGALIISVRAVLSKIDRFSVLVATAAGAGIIVLAPAWDQELLAGAAYNHARQKVSAGSVGGALVPLLKAGSLLYYREGAAATVSVKRLNGATSLAIDGKVDASTSGDMLTQKALAHLPLLLHDSPRNAAIIGLGSGVTLASALVHPVEQVDVLELSPEVVEASRHFADVNRNSLSDRRVRLIVGDGRSHLLLARARYDVIVSEPSNPWMAGVASLFTKEFFTAARDRLAPGGILCQWAHAYDMSAADLRSIVATFAAVFPHGTMWLVGDGDLLLIGANGATEPDLRNLERGWRRPGVAADLDTVAARDPFALLSMFVGGPAHMQSYAAGAVIQTDDRLSLEFSGPAAIFGNTASDNTTALKELRDSEPLPLQIARAIDGADAAAWRNRGKMMVAADANEAAYESFASALDQDPTDSAALDGLVDAAVAAQQSGNALMLLERITGAEPDAPAPWIALSRLYAATGRYEDALNAAMTACDLEPMTSAALAQLASLYADVGDARRLSPIADLLQRMFPDSARSSYYAAAAEFLHERLEQALTFVRHAITLDQGYAEAHNLIGAIHARLGQTGEARTAFRTALRLNPRDSATYINFGLMELAAGNRESAAHLFGEALALDPTSAAGRQGLIEARLASR